MSGLTIRTWQWHIIQQIQLIHTSAPETHFHLEMEWQFLSYWRVYSHSQTVKHSSLTKTDWVELYEYTIKTRFKHFKVCCNLVHSTSYAIKVVRQLSNHKLYTFVSLFLMVFVAICHRTVTSVHTCSFTTCFFRNNLKFDSKVWT